MAFWFIFLVNNPRNAVKRVSVIDAIWEFDELIENKTI